MKIHTRAFSLIEVILSVAMLSIVAFGVFSAWLYGEEAVVRSGDRNRAVLLASEGADVVRNIRDGDFNTLIDGTYSLQKNNLWWLLVPGDLEKVGPYSRKVTISSVDTTHKKVTVTVYWSGVGGIPEEVTFDTILTKWRAPGQFPVVVHGGGSVPECSDGVDNDSDGLIDYPDDHGCVGPTGNNEAYYAVCNDSFDNDGDTLVDYPADTGCTDLLDENETNSGGGGGGPSSPSIIALKEVSGVTKIQRRQIAHDNGFVYGITGEASKNPVIYYFSVEGSTGLSEIAQTFITPTDAGLDSLTMLTNLYVTENYLYVTTNDPNHDLLIFSIDNGTITLRQSYNVVTEDSDKATATDVFVNFTSGNNTDDVAYVTFTDNVVETVVSLSVQDGPVFFPPARLDGHLVSGGGVELCGKDTSNVFIAAASEMPIIGIDITTPASLSTSGQASAGAVRSLDPLSISCPIQESYGFLGASNSFVDFNISVPSEPVALGLLTFTDDVVKDIALDATGTGYVFLATTNKNQFKVIDVTDSTQPALHGFLDTGEDLTGIAYDPHFNYVYAVSATQLYVINPGL
jgi:hypothetical protein